MKNYMTLKQLMICAKDLEENAESCHRIGKDRRENMEAIWDIPAESRTEKDIKDANFFEIEMNRWFEKETALLALAGIIEDLKVEVCLMTEGVQ